MSKNDKVHATYHAMKPIMQKHFPHLFAEPVPLALDTLSLRSMKRKLAKAGTVIVEGGNISEKHIKMFLTCWTARREYKLKVSQSEFRINFSGVPVSPICDKERTAYRQKYFRICRRQQIQE